MIGSAEGGKGARTVFWHFTCACASARTDQQLHRNWTACYATGLLLARRVLKKLKLDEIYEGQLENDGEDFLIEEKEDQPKPFSVCLDVGLQTTSTGARIFGALKGALDGGLYIPHSVRRWPAAEKDQVESELLAKYIYGGHVGEYMEAMQEDDEELSVPDLTPFSAPSFSQLPPFLSFFRDTTLSRSQGAICLLQWADQTF